MSDNRMTRRTFIGSTASAVTLSMAPAHSSPLLAQHQSKIPTVPFGEYRVSRLLVGGNPVSGNSHMSSKLSREMTEYFTAANVKKMLDQCEKAGINTWQSRGDRHIRRLLLEYRGDGGQIQWIVQTASEFASFSGNVKSIMSQKPIAIYHHGSRTDRYWKNGEIDKIKDDLKVIRDSGTRVGIASHNPQVLEYIEERNWDIDFYMACFYNVNKRINGEEAYLDEDRQAMCRFIQNTPKQCIAFKILAAGRNAKTPQDVEKAFRFAFDNIKPNDVVDVGMFPKYSNQVADNAKIVAKILA